MRNGFTMIELIFSIVIIGILASVAVPKLSATRDDAKVVSEIASTQQARRNLVSAYMAKGDVVFTNGMQLKYEGSCLTAELRRIGSDVLVGTYVNPKCTELTEDVQKRIKDKALDFGMIVSGNFPATEKLNGLMVFQ